MHKFFSILLLTLCVLTPAHAGGVDAENAIAYFPGSRIEIRARFEISLSQEVEDTLHNGVSLPFVVEFELTRPRWRAWLGASASDSLSYRLSYQALTRKYRVEYSNQSRDFETLEEALQAMGNITHWQILSQSTLASDSTAFAGRIRFRLDISRLPKTYQLSAIGQEDWDLSSAWTPLTITNDLTGNRE